MSKKTLFVSLILFGLFSIAMTNVAFADAQSLMKQADRYNDKEYYYQAKEIYQTIAKDYPNTDYALAAQRKLVCVNIALDNYQQADAEFNKLITAFANNKELPLQVHEIGFICRTIGKYNKAEYYYNYVIENFPDNKQAIFSQKDLVKTAIEAEDYTAEQQMLDKLKSKYANHPDLAESLCSVADGCIKKKRYSRANELNKYVVNNFPGSDHALKAQKNLVKTYIATNDKPNTEAATKKLSTDFANHPGLPATIRSIANGYCDEGNYGKAIELYQNLIETYPNDPNRIHSQKSLAVSNIWCNEDTNNPNTKAAVDSLVTEFGGHSDFALAVFRIGEENYKKGQELSKDNLDKKAKGNFSKAIEIWQQVIQRPPIEDLTVQTHYLMAECYMQIDDYNNAIVHYQKVVSDWPASKYTIESQKYLAIANIDIGNDADVQKKLEQLMTDFKDSPFLPRVVFHIGEEYYKKATESEKEGQIAKSKDLCEKALNIWEIIIIGLDAKPSRLANSYFYSAQCCDKLGRYTKAVDYYQKTVDICPEFGYAWYAQFMVGYCSQKFAEAGVISKSEAQVKTKDAYQRLLEKYPDCRAVGAARNWLRKHTN